VIVVLFVILNFFPEEKERRSRLELLVKYKF
jgi:hypothetical protein